MTNAHNNVDANSHHDSNDQLNPQNSITASAEIAVSESSVDSSSLDNHNADNQEAVVSTTEINQSYNEAPEPQMKKVDIVIAGNTYQIYCPINEEEALRSAVYVINNSVLDIKAQAPNLTQENLLVLCCLNLQEKIHTQQKDVEQHHHNTEQSEMLLNKIIEDADSVLL